MALKNVMIELRHRDEPGGLMMAGRMSALPEIPGLTIDDTFPAVRVPHKDGVAEISDALMAGISPDAVFSPQNSTLLVRGTLDEEMQTSVLARTAASREVIGIYADPLIQTCPITCGGSAPVGTNITVARSLSVDKLEHRGMNGRDVLLAIVDTGIDLKYLQSKGINPATNSSLSWVPVAGTTPFQFPVNHGTMCAFDSLIAAPKATLLDIAVLSSTKHGGSVMEGLLSDAVLAYTHLLNNVMPYVKAPGGPGALVVSNSWGMFQMSWDYPKGDPKNYSDNPQHPFNRVVVALEKAGADILFAAGNCGHECPDSRCGTEKDAGIYGANSSASVLSIAGVDVNENRVGYSTRGPGHLSPRKPDISGYTHFSGSGVYAADSGTSAATPVVAGVVAAFRSVFPLSPKASPAAIRYVVTHTAEDRGAPGWDIEYGWGIVNGAKLAAISTLPIVLSGAGDETSTEAAHQTSLEPVAG